MGVTVEYNLSGSKIICHQIPIISGDLLVDTDTNEQHREGGKGGCDINLNFDLHI